jgi:hypothetical protein
VIVNLSELRAALFVYTMALHRKDLRPETLERLEYRVKKACADVAFPVDKSRHPSNVKPKPWESTDPTQADLAGASRFLTVLEGGKKGT